MKTPIQRLVAIDPGASGGIAYTDANGEIPTVEQMPMTDFQNETELTAVLKLYSERGYKFYMEKVGGFIPDENGEGQPGSRMFVFGDGYGFIRGVLAACGNPPVLVVPQRWQRGFPKFKAKADRKRAFKAHAQKVFPHLAVTLATADALCLLHFAQAQESGQFKPPVPSQPIGARVGFAASPVANRKPALPANWKP
jgi:hypothetical protein